MYQMTICGSPFEKHASITKPQPAKLLRGSFVNNSPNGNQKRRPDMKTINGLIGAALLCLVHMTSHAATPDVPADLRAVGNQLEFVSHLARGCDVDLTVYGLKGAYQHDCTTFRAQVPEVMAAFSKDIDRWGEMEALVDHSTDQRIRSEWSVVGSQIERSMRLIEKTVAHIKFVITGHEATQAKELKTSAPVVKKR
jgi:hypothetical protein